MITNLIKEVKKFYLEVYETTLSSKSLDELKQMNDKMIKFYQNPLVCKNETEDEKLYSFICYQILGFYSDFVRKTEYAKGYMEYIDQILQCIPNGANKLRSTVLQFSNDVSRKISRNIKSLSETDNEVRKVVLESDLDSYNYLYYYGERITENQLQIVDFFNNNVNSELLDQMAENTINAFLRGLENSRIDVDTKEYLLLDFPIGFEKLAKRIYELLDGKLYIVFRCTSLPFDKQVDYNHRYDYNAYLTKEHVDAYISEYEQVTANRKNQFLKYAGPIYIEVFGENRFVPQNGFEIYEKEEKLAKLNSDFDTKYANIYWKNVYIKSSFCIISYPCPEIGKDFKKIFADTIKINTLDNDKYVKIHQTIIDVLDKAESVHITGKNGNNTDIIVSLADISDSNNESKFENCCADVNVPVGEVFTSPKLAGTNGVLNVSKIYLNGWKFENLNLTIKDGLISEYDCSNFDNLLENKEYINEHILFDHSTLPMGEFAIGTNTLAYVMGNKYQINDKLDILIAEKTGPHFAFGDTCYSMEEDNDTFNPDGKKIVAKDNEISIKRLSEDEAEQEKAYFGCHTDVTIPYYELGDVIAIKKDGSKIAIIQNGRFVLAGTEELNVEGM